MHSLNIIDFHPKRFDRPLEAYLVDKSLNKMHVCILLEMMMWRIKRKNFKRKNSKRDINPQVLIYRKPKVKSKRKTIGLYNVQMPLYLRGME
jgi:hypothetical protein